MTKAERTSRQRALVLDSGVLVVGGGSPTPETRLAGVRLFAKLRQTVFDVGLGKSDPPWPRRIELFTRIKVESGVGSARVLPTGSDRAFPFMGELLRSAGLIT